MPDLRTPSFNDLNLQVGARLQLMLHGSQKTFYYSSLIGYVAGEYLLVKIPIENGLSVPLHEGERVIVRVFSGVAVYTFNCNVESVLLAPRFYMHLSFPQTIAATPVRKAARVKVNLPAQIRRDAGPHPGTAALVDLSISGALIMADTELGTPGDRISIAFAFRVRPTNQEVRIETDATIRSCRPLDQNAGSDAALAHGAGIQFTGIGANDQVMLQHFLYEANGHRLLA